MGNATDMQMQKFSNERYRVHAERLRALLLALKDDKAAIDDVYQRADKGAVWNDDRTDGPPHLATSASLLSYNSFISDIIADIEGHPEWPNVLKGCVNAVF